MSPLPGERVLIADADPGLRRQIQKRLEDSGVAADGVADGRSAMQRLRESSYGVILLDIALPHLGAERVLEFMRHMPARERPVILVIAEPSAARSLDVDLVQIVLRKPCDLNQLAELVQSCVQTALAHREPRGEQGAIAV